MKWKTIKTNAGHDAYRLWHNDEELLSMVIHPASKTVRVNSTQDKRVFQIRKEGFWKNKTVLCNEYGVKLGEIGIDAHGKFIRVEAERYYYNLPETPGQELILFKDTISNPAAVCNIELDEKETTTPGMEAAKLATYSGMLIALCRYLVISPSSAIINFPR